MKKFFSYPVFLVIFLSFIATMGFGAVIKYHYDGGKKFQFLQKSAVLISSVPFYLTKMIKYKTFNLDKLVPLNKHKNKKRFEQFKENERNALLVMSRYDYSLGRSIVEIIDLKDFRTIHVYKHDIEVMNKKIRNKKFKRLSIDASINRFLYTHPLVFENGNLISKFNGPAFMLDFCSNLMWLNEEERVHHSINIDAEGMIYHVGDLTPPSKYVKKYNFEKHNKTFVDSAIIKTNINGKIIYKKSVLELLIENELYPDNFANNFVASKAIGDGPIHLNDVQPAFKDTKFWKKGDLFLSTKNQSAIILYRPSTNKVIKYLTGPFSEQHDVDIISDKEISIFNNNNFFGKNKYSEILVYNFETKTFKKLFNDQLQKENFKTRTNGLSHIFKDGSLMVEEQNHGRMIMFNNKGEKEWEFVNKDKNDNIGFLKWSRIIEDEIFIKKFKSLVKNKTCLN